MLLKGSWWANFTGSGYDFDLMWGPSRGGAPVDGFVTGDPPQITLRKGYVFLAGQLPQPSPQRLARVIAAPTLSAGWPIVVTNNISAAADGTIFLVNAEPAGGPEWVLRLDPGNSLKVYCTANAVASEQSTDDSTLDKIMVWPDTGGAVKPPMNLSDVANAKPFRDAIVALAQARGARFPTTGL
jgi:hypothetical protein